MTNILQVDIDRASNVLSSLHNLWSLPIQIIIAFVLLYSQVKLAFLAGIILILVMIPLNSVIAKNIGLSTAELMKHKDLRMKIISEVITTMKGIKMCSWETVVLRISNGHRVKELKYLGRQKYLDAICVFLWAAMPVLVPFATFMTSALVFHEELTAPQVWYGYACHERNT